MKIINLINDTYQVVDEDNTTAYFQGNLTDCNFYIIGIIR